MELKLLYMELKNKENDCLNRTFMELKLLRFYDNVRIDYVLIAPLWNWNSAAKNLINNCVCLNRTFMELKLRFDRRTVVHTWS